MSEATPRVLAAHLANFTNRTVRIVGRVAQVRGNTATLDAEGQVSVTLSPVRRRRVSLLPRVWHARRRAAAWARLTRAHAP